MTDLSCLERYKDKTAERQMVWGVFKPTAVALGADHSFGDVGTFSVDLTYTDWKGFELIENGQSVNPVSGKEENSGGTVAFRIGGEYLWLRQDSIIPFRGGLGVDPEPAESGQGVFYTASIGTGYAKDDWVIDWGLQVRFGFDIGKSTYQGIDGEATVTQVKSVLGVVRWF